MSLRSSDPAPGSTVSTEEPPMPRASDASESASTHAPIHVLFIIDAIVANGGGEGALLKTIRYLPPERFRCSVVAFKSGPFAEMFRQAGCEVQTFPIGTIFSFRAIKAAWLLRKFIRTENAQVVHTFFETANLWGALVAKLAGGPVVVSSRRDLGILRSRKHRIAYRVIHRLFDSVVAVSEPVRKACIEEEGVAPDKVVTIHNGVELGKRVNTGERAHLRRTLSLDGASHVITSVGHIRRFKGFDVMVRAAAQVCREFPKAVFVIVGAFYDPEYINELKSAARALGISDNIRFAGAMEDVAPALGASDAFCLLSRSEGFSNALIEAMASGLPVVATRVGGAEETILDGLNGFLVDLEDADSAAARILTLLKNPTLSAQMGAAARQTVQSKFTAEIVANALADHYEHLLMRKPASKPTPQLQTPQSSEARSGPGGKSRLYSKKMAAEWSLKFVAKWIVIRLLWCTGLLAMAKLWIRWRGSVVLSFHRILRGSDCSDTLTQAGMVVKEQTFSKLLNHLQSSCTLFDLRTEPPALGSKRLQVAVTFDDGWEDNASVVFPIVEKHAVPLTIFVCPALVDQALPFWPEQITALIRAAEGTSDGVGKIRQTLAAAGYGQCENVLNAEASSRADRLIEFLKTLPSVKRRRLLEALLRVDLPSGMFIHAQLDRTMSWLQITELQKGGVCFGSHTQHHEILPRLELSQMQEELVGSKASLRQHLGSDSALFSYPNGEAGPDAREAVLQAGYKLGFKNSPGIWRPGDDPLLIPRTNLCETHLVDRGGQFSYVRFEYAVFWRSFIHDVHARIRAWWSNGSHVKSMRVAVTHRP